MTDSLSGNAEYFLACLSWCLVPLYRTLSECNFPQFPETLHYVYKVAIEGPRRSEDSIVTIIFFAEVSFNGRL